MRQSKHPAFLIFALLIPLSVLSAEFITQFASSKNIRGITVRDNYLWLATSGGLVRYDRTTQAQLVFPRTGDIPDQNLTASVEGPDGTTWFGTEDGYIVRFDPRTHSFRQYNSLQAVQWKIRCMKKFNEYLLVGTTEGLSIFSFSRDRIIQNATAFGGSKMTLVEAIKTRGDTVALVLPDGIASAVISDPERTNFFDPSLWTFTAVDGARDVLFTQDGLVPANFRVLKLGTYALEFHDDGSVYRNGTLIGQFGVPVNCAARTDGDTLFLGAEGTYMHAVGPSGGYLYQVVLNSPPASDFRDCMVNDDGSLWFVTGDIGNGIGIHARNNWQTLTDPAQIGGIAGSRPVSPNTIFKTSSGDIWVGTYSRGVKWFNKSRNAWRSFEDPYAPNEWFQSPITRFRADSLLWWTLVSGVCEDSAGYIWIANDRAYDNNLIHIFDPRTEQWRSLSMAVYGLQTEFTGKLAAVYDAAANRHHIYLTYVKEGSQGRGGFSILSYQGSALESPISIAHCTNENPFYDIAVAADTLVWLTSSDGLYSVADNRVANLKKEQIPAITSSPHALAVRPDGNPVMGMDGDLYLYRCSTFVERNAELVNLTRHGLLGTPIYDIEFVAREGAYWICSDKGIFHFKGGAYFNPDIRDYGGVIAVPNPFSLSRHTEIVFDRIKPRTRIVVYDGAGAVVRQLAADSRWYPNLVRWDGTTSYGRGLSVGTYYYRAFDGSSSAEVRKILVIP